MQEKNQFTFGHVIFLGLVIVITTFTGVGLYIYITGPSTFAQLNQLQQRYFIQGTAISAPLPMPVQPSPASVPTTELQWTFVDPPAVAVQPSLQAQIMVDDTPTPQPPLPSYTRIKTCMHIGIYSQPVLDQKYLIAMAPKGTPLYAVARTPDLQWIKLLQQTETLQLWVPAAGFCFTQQ